MGKKPNKLDGFDVENQGRYSRRIFKKPDAGIVFAGEVDYLVLFKMAAFGGSERGGRLDSWRASREHVVCDFC